MTCDGHNETMMDRIIAHRGGALHRPENTLEAFRWAASVGCRWVEFDVQLAACGTPVVIHDETLERTTNLKGPVLSKTAAQLAQADASSASAHTN